MLFFTAPIVYPVTLLPEWMREIIAFNPFVQILQDTRRVIVGPDAEASPLVEGYVDHVASLGVMTLLLVVGVWLYRREAPRFAEVT